MTDDATRRRLSDLEREGRWDDALDQTRRIADPAEERRARARVEAKRALFEEPASGRPPTRDLRDDVQIEVVAGGAAPDPSLLIAGALRVRGVLATGLGLETDRPIVIRVYDSRSRIDTDRHPSVLAAPGWSAGVADGVVRLFVGGRGVSDRAITTLVEHEAVHLLIARTTGGRCPRWLDEGLAIRFTQELPASYATALDRAIADDRVLPLDLLAGPFEELERPDLIDLAYAQSLSVTNHLFDTLGTTGIGALLRNIGTSGVDEAWTLAGLSPWLIEREWHRARRGGDAS